MCFGAEGLDGDGVNDAEDAFPDNASIDSDRDNDGVADEFDAYPDDDLEVSSKRNLPTQVYSLQSLYF